MNFLSSRSGGTIGGALEAALDADVNVSEMPHPAQAAVDSRTIYEYAITNLSFSPAYGIQSTLPIPSEMEVLAVRGWQGQVSVTNGRVLYGVGPLASGNAATIKLDLVPTRTGLLSATAAATVVVGDGLVDSNLANNTVMSAPLTVAPPLLSLAKAPGGAVELTWVSETGRPTLETATMLNGTPQWRSVTNAPAIPGPVRALRLPATGPSKVFRLRFS